MNNYSKIAWSYFDKNVKQKMPLTYYERYQFSSFINTVTCQRLLAEKIIIYANLSRASATVNRG